MITGHQIRNLVASYAKHGDLERFAVDFAQTSFDVLRTGDADAIALSWAVQGKLALLRAGDISPADLQKWAADESATSGRKGDTMTLVPAERKYTGTIGLFVSDNQSGLFPSMSVYAKDKRVVGLLQNDLILISVDDFVPTLDLTVPPATGYSNLDLWDGRVPVKVASPALLSCVPLR